MINYTSFVLNKSLYKIHLLLLSVVLCCCNGEKKRTSISCENISVALVKSANYLEKSTKKNGMFEYRFNMNPFVNVRPRYNVLRHAGSIYSMVSYYKINPRPKIGSAIERSGAFLRDKTLLSVSGKDNMKAIWSDPKLTRSSKSIEAKLGGAGISLVALLSIESINPGFTSISDLRDLGHFIRYMQKEDGSFYSKYNPSNGGRNDKWVSLYYPGEAALGLVMLYEKDPSKIWLESAYNAMKYLAISRKNSDEIPADHWALLATEKILSTKNKQGINISRELLINHAKQICESILAEQVNDSENPIFDGGFNLDGRVTPTATRLEGLLAVLKFIPQDDEIWDRIRVSVDQGISFLLQAQVKEGGFEGAFPRAVDKMTGDSFIARKFNKRATEVRIDYVQHAMSALIEYQELIECF